MRPRDVAIFGLVLTALQPARVAVAQQESRAYVLDTGARSLVAVELPSGKRAGALALSGTPTYLLESPERSRVVVLDPGPGEEKGERGYKAAGKSSATIVDAATLAVVARVELCSGVARGASFSPDGARLTVLCPGYEAKNPAESQARELVNIDLATGREAGRLTLEPGSMPIAASKDGRTLAVIQGLPRTDKFPYAKSRVYAVDLAGPTLRAKFDAGTWSGLYSDGEHFYLMDPGKPDDNPQKNRNGTIQIATLASDAPVASVDAGREPGGLYQDEEAAQVYVPSAGPPGSADGELRVLRGATVAATLKVAARPRLVVRQRDTVYVVGERAVTLVDPAALEVRATIPLARASEALVDDDDLPTELKVSPDGKRAFAHYGLHHKVATLDLEAGKATGATKTGRGGKKFLGNMMGGMFGVAGMLAAGYSMWIHTNPSMLAVRPDGRYAYAINNQTKDITVVDGATGRSVEMIAGYGYSLEPLSDGRSLVEVSGSELRLVDMESQKAQEIPLPDLRGLFFTKDRSLGIALAKQVVLVLDGASGKELARLTGFTSADAIALP
jgi:DNA-binding beta-propeller fold protein YncE